LPPNGIPPVGTLISRKDLFYCRIRIFFMEANFSGNRVGEYSKLEEKFNLGYAYPRNHKGERKEDPPRKEVDSHMGLGELSVLTHGHDQSDGKTFELMLIEHPLPEKWRDLKHHKYHFYFTKHLKAPHWRPESNPLLKNKILPYTFETPLDDYLKIVYDGGDKMVRIDAGVGHANTIKFVPAFEHGGFCYTGKELGLHLRINGKMESDYHVNLMSLGK
jgi:hypothetical protein